MGTIGPFTSALFDGGAYLMIIGGWITIAVAFAFISFWAGRLTRAENDGCLLAIANVLMTGLGGALGWLFFKNHYPFVIVSSLLGALILPSLCTAAFLRKGQR